MFKSAAQFVKAVGIINSTSKFPTAQILKAASTSIFKSAQIVKPVQIVKSTLTFPADQLLNLSQIIKSTPNHQNRRNHEIYRKVQISPKL